MATVNRIIERIATQGGCTTIGLLAQHLGLTDATVRRHVKALIAAGRVQHAWDGVGLQLSDAEVAEVAEVAERAVDARVATHR